MATDEHILASLEKYHEPYAIFDDYYCGAIWSATVLQEQGVAALPRFAPMPQVTTAPMLRHINHPFALTLLIRVAGQTKRRHDRMTKAIAAFPHAAMAALDELGQKEENSWRIMLMTMLISQPALAEQAGLWLSTPAVAVLKSCQQQLTQPSNHASADSLPAVVVSSLAFEKEKSPIPVLDLAPLGIEPICYLTEEINSNQLLAKYIWYSKHITVSHEEVLPTCWQGWAFNDGSLVHILKLPKVVEAWLNEDYSTLLSEFKVFHSPTGHYWQLGILTTLLLEKAVKAWNALLLLSPHTDTEYSMLHFGLKGLPASKLTLARYPQEALPITNYFAASELAPAVASRLQQTQNPTTRRP